MRLTIIGAGNVGAVLGKGWARAGHVIVYGVRNPQDPKHGAAAEGAGGAKVASVAEAVVGADAIVLAVPWAAAPAAVSACGDLAGRVLIDVTNPLRSNDGALELAVGFETSAAEQLAALAKGAAVVKTMNQVGAGVMAVAAAYTPRPVMFAAGDDEKAKALALGLVSDLGFDARDAGPLKMARLLEPLAMLWTSQVMAHRASPESAFAFLRGR
ncbi:MAG TPA: NAD(P)-binding domain-containing protein [Caulobacteraceae bacterium]|nr:NAD(P)-binding domain-containing protein [Caulobacteraceae bacterium]